MTKMNRPASVETSTPTDVDAAPRPRRRLSDKPYDAIQQAARQGHREIEKRLTLIYEATMDEEDDDRRRWRHNDYR
jgi:hypothetical protein